MPATGSQVTSRAVHILLATDADWLVDDVVAALGGPDTSFTVCREGRGRRRQVVAAERRRRLRPRRSLDLQIGSMGGMAVTMALRLDASAGRLPHVPVLMLLDRVADVHLAKRCGADGWLVKPLDPLRLGARRAPSSPAAPYTEGVADPPCPTPSTARVARPTPTRTRRLERRRSPTGRKPAPAG